MTAIRRQRPIPATIGLAFGALWGGLGVQSLPPSWRSVAIVLVWLVAAALVVRLWRSPATEGPARGLFGRKAYLVAVALEVAAIAAASALLPRFGLQSLFVEVVGVIVGLHFIGLWQATGLTLFLWIAGGMCCVSIAGMILPMGDMVTGFGNAAVLWFFAGRSTR